MSITLAVGATTVSLPADLRWSDESWQPVEQTVQRTITGALIVSTALRVAGRPITLAPLDDSSSWTRKTVLDQVRAWAAVPGQLLTLTLRGTSYTVMFRHQDGAIEANAVIHYDDVAADDAYLATFRFMVTA